MDEAPSDGRSSCRRSVRTTSRVTRSEADSGSTAAQTECGSSAARSLAVRQTRLTQMGSPQLATQFHNISLTLLCLYRDLLWFDTGSHKLNRKCLADKSV